MPKMTPKIVKHDGNFDKDQLQTNLRMAEAVMRKLTKIEAKNGSTYSTHDRQTKVPVNSLELVLDPNGNASGPPGSTLIVRGTAIIDGKEEKVALFRI